MVSKNKYESFELSSKKGLGLKEAFATVVGTVIGAGVFFKAASVASVVTSPFLHLFSWFLGGVLTLIAGLTAAEIAAAIPKTGGMMCYLEYTYGKRIAFLLGWTQTLVYFPANSAALSIIFSTQLVNLLQLSNPNKMVIPLGILTLVSLYLLNFLGTKVGGIFQVITLVGKLIPIALIVFYGWFQTESIDFQLFFSSSSGSGNSLWVALSGGLLATMFAYDGWIMVGNIAGEFRKPQKQLPQAIFFGILCISVVYIAINAVFLRAMPLGELAGNANAASQVAGIIFGSYGGKIITIGILISTYGCINGYTLTAMQIPYTLAKMGEFPFQKTLTKVTKRTRVPLNAGLFQLSLAIIMMLFGAFETLTNMIVFVIWIFYTLIFIAVIILRKREPDLLRPYKVMAYPVLPIIAILGGLFIVISTLILQFKLAMVGVVLTLLGLPVYSLIHKKEKK